MRKVIDGEVCDTKTARKIFETTNGESWLSPFYLYEALFVTETGEYFLYGEGGHLRAFWRQYRRQMSGSINTVTEEGAKKWLKKYAPVRIVRETFGKKRVKI